MTTDPSAAPDPSRSSGPTAAASNGATRRGPEGVALSIIIPAYNEEAVIGETVRRLVAHFRAAPHSFEILAVDNNSKDATAAVLTDLAATFPECRWIASPPRPGYGVAVRAGLDAYRGEAAVIVMADGSETPEDVAALYRLIENGADCGFGTRFRGEDRTAGYPKTKLRLNRLGNRLISTLIGYDYDDFTNGFKAYRRWVIDAMRPLRGEEFELTVEMAMKAVASGASIEVAANSWRERDAGGSKFKVARQSMRYLGVMPPILRASDSAFMAFVRFALVGATSSAVYLAVLSAMVELAGASATLGAVVAYLVGTVVSYVGSAKFAFQRSMTRRNLARFLAVVGASFALNTLIAYTLERAGVHYLLIGAAVILCVSAFNFLSHRFWTFRGAPAE